MVSNSSIKGQIAQVSALIRKMRLYSTQSKGLINGEDSPDYGDDLTVQENQKAKVASE